MGCRAMLKPIPCRVFAVPVYRHHIVAPSCLLEGVKSQEPLILIAYGGKQLEKVPNFAG